MKKRTIFSTSLFVLSTMLIFWLLQTMFFNNEVSWAREYFYESLDDDIDVVYIGNSHSLWAFQPAIIDKLINLKSYNLGTWGQDIKQTFFEIETLLESKSPKLILLELETLTVEIDASRTVLEIPILQTELPISLPMVENHSAWKTPDDLWQNFHDMLNYVSGNKINEAAGGLSTGYQPNYNVMSAGVSGSQGRDVIQPLNPDVEFYIRKIISLCKERGVKLVFIKTPMYSVHSYSFKGFNALLTETETNYYDLNIGNQLSRLHFRDVDHVSTFSSIIVSVETAQIIVEELGLPLSEEGLDYYSSFFFTDYEIIRANGISKITLFPAAVNQRLQYRWEVTYEGEELTQSGFHGDPFFTFQTVSTGEYKIRVYIQNTNGAYILEGIYTYVVE